MLKKLIKCIGEYKVFAILTPIIVIFDVVLEVIIPYILSLIIDVGITNGDIRYISIMGSVMIGLAVIALILGIISGRLSAIAGTGFAKNVRKKVFGNIQNFSFENLDKFGTASLITRLTTDVTNLQNAFMLIIRIMVRAPLMLIGATCMAVIMNPSMSLVFLIAIPFIVIAFIILMVFGYPRFIKMLDRYDEMSDCVQENLKGIRVVKTFVRRDFENKKYEERTKKLRDISISAEKILIMDMPVMMFAMYACMIAIIWIGGNKIVTGEMLPGQLMSFISYIMQVLMSLMMLTFVFLIAVLSRASAVRITQALDEVSLITDENADPSNRVTSGDIEFKNVSFSYFKSADNLVLKDINLKIGSGQTIGIIGGTGSSKTSLVQLIPRLYDTYSGEVIVSGHNVKNILINELRDTVSVVLQKNVLFTGTIKENLLWGNENATDEDIIQACKFAQAHEFIASFADGYETKLGQGGVNVSGGQKQRLCIARAMLKNPKVLILDDSTSAVDTATESKIRNALRDNFKGTTKIIIAQRITSVSEADQIIVLDDGKICEIGTHSELLKINGVYAEVYQSQQKGVK